MVSRAGVPPLTSLFYLFLSTLKVNINTFIEQKMFHFDILEALLACDYV